MTNRRSIKVKTREELPSDYFGEWKKKWASDPTIPYHKRTTGEVVRRLHKRLFPHIPHKNLAKAMLHATKAFKDRYNKSEVNSCHNYEFYVYHVNNDNNLPLATHTRDKDGKRMELYAIHYKYSNEVYYAISVDGVIVTFITEDMKFTFKDSETVGDRLYNSKLFGNKKWFREWRKDYATRHFTR